MLLELYQALSALTTSSLNFSSSALTSSSCSTANGVKKRKVGCIDIESCSNISRPLLQLTPPGYSLSLVRHCHSTQRYHCLQLPFRSVRLNLFSWPGSRQHCSPGVHLHFPRYPGWCEEPVWLHQEWVIREHHHDHVQAAIHRRAIVCVLSQQPHHVTGP